MVEYEIEAPDGQTYTVSGPEGATQEQVQAEVLNQNPSLSGQGAPEKEHGALAKANDFREGLWSSVVDTGYGINELVTGDLRPDQRAYADDLRTRSKESGWGTGGRVVGEIGMLMAPGGALGAAGKVASKLPKAATALKAAAAATKGLKYDIAASAALGGTQLPQAGDSRLGNAAWGAGGALAGAGLAKTMDVLGEGIKRTPAAQRLIDQGVRMTPGKASVGKAVENTENIMKRVPPTARATQEFRQRAFEDFNGVFLNKVAPEGKKITAIGQEGFEQQHKAFKSSYDDARATAGRPSNEGLVSIVNQATKAGTELPGSAGYVMKSILEDVNKLSREYTPKGLQTLDSTLRSAQEAAYTGANPEKYLGDTIKNIRKTLRNSVSGGVTDKLDAVDSKWAEYLPARVASESKAAVKSGGIIDDDMLAGALTVTGRGRQGRGKAPSQELYNDLRQTLGKVEPQMMLDVTKAAAAGIPSPNTLMDFMGRGLTGQNKVQKLLRPGYEDASIQALLESLRMPTAGKVGGAYGNE
jgi:hypothetical protein